MTKYEVTYDGRTVWVNSPEGMCVGRFSRNGIDVHHDYETQMHGGSQCLDCSHGTIDLASWDHFRTSMKRHYGVDVPQEAMPAFLRQWRPST